MISFFYGLYFLNFGHRIKASFFNIVHVLNDELSELRSLIEVVTLRIVPFIAGSTA
jgi:hypothetical protein